MIPNRNKEEIDRFTEYALDSEAKLVSLSERITERGMVFASSVLVLSVFATRIENPVAMWAIFGSRGFLYIRDYFGVCQFLCDARTDSRWRSIRLG